MMRCPRVACGSRAAAPSAGRTLVLLLLLLTRPPASVAAGSAPPADRLGEALSLVGLDRGHVGIRPRGDWTRFPDPEGIPHLLPFFADLHADPLALYDFARTMGNAVEDSPDPAAAEDGHGSLYHLVYFLGVARREAGFRNYSVNLPPRTGEDEGEASGSPRSASPPAGPPGPSPPSPLLRALDELWLSVGQAYEYRSFGQVAEGTQPRREALERITTLHPALAGELAWMVRGLTEAARWRRVAFRNVPRAVEERVLAIRDLGETLGDGQKYYPEIDDLAARLDEPSLEYAGMKCAQLAEESARRLARLRAEEGRALETGLPLDLPTPLGRIVVTGSGNDRHTDPGTCLLLDLGGDDVYEAPVAASEGARLPVALAIDLTGNDAYRSPPGAVSTQGAGLLGVGILLDLEGDDRYEAATLSQGAALFGLGVLADFDGRDAYRLETSGQGGAFFGIGLLADREGDDRYDLWGEGQGFGGSGGIGVLADRRGDDEYRAEPRADVVDRGDYHSDHEINVNNAQGVGAGRRGDGSDGHSWAGGLGALVDAAGDDLYFSGNWSQGCGYWFGTGLLWDGAGRDRYESVYFTQASGAHFAMGALIDEGGDDTHVLRETAGAGLAFGWDFVNALLVDKGGNDSYEAKSISLGNAQIRSNALFFDLEGNDRYRLDRGQPGMGEADFREDYRTPKRTAPYMYYAGTLAVFLDIGGDDSYETRDPESGRVTSRPDCGNDRHWFRPEPGGETSGHRNHGIGLDAPEGVVPDFVRFDEDVRE